MRREDRETSLKYGVSPFSNKGVHPLIEGARSGAMSERKSAAMPPYSNPLRKFFENESFTMF
jgi:hypothetical protein